MIILVCSIVLLILCVVLFVLVIVAYCRPTQQTTSTTKEMSNVNAESPVAGGETRVSKAPLYTQPFVKSTDGTYHLDCTQKVWSATPEWNAAVGTKLYGRRTWIDIYAGDTVTIKQYSFRVAYNKTFPQYVERTTDGWTIYGFNEAFLQDLQAKGLVQVISGVYHVGIDIKYVINIWPYLFTTGFTDQIFVSSGDGLWTLPMLHVGNADGQEYATPGTTSYNGKVVVYKKSDSITYNLTNAFYVSVITAGAVEVKGFTQVMINTLINNGYVGKNSANQYYVLRDAWAEFMN